MELRKWTSVEDLLGCCPENSTIGDSLVKTWARINNPSYEKILCSVSGGADSDVILDMCWRCDPNNKVIYVWFDTGLEYQATKDHLNFLREKYDIEILIAKAVKSIPLTCKEIGQPFMSKYVSDMIQRLQRHGFKWEDKPFEELYQEYPKCKVALQWWCTYEVDKGGPFDINRNKYLKEFLIEYPPRTASRIDAVSMLKKTCQAEY